MTSYKACIDFDTDSEEVLLSIRYLLESSLPYMVDNVNIYIDREREVNEEA
jgi:hypothetical protein